MSEVLEYGEMPPKDVLDEWQNKHKKNIDKWGIQHPAIILLAMQEELGELTQAWLQGSYEDLPKDEIWYELTDLAALMRGFYVSMYYYENPWGINNA